ncbi:MAG: hypothetical protein R3C99_19345 [Pirellulaceae bacterium]
MDASDALVHAYDVPRIVAGRNAQPPRSLFIAAHPPFGFNSPVYVLHAVDIGNDLIEGAGESDNSGLGSGIDSRQLTVTDNPPTGDDPVIGTFTLSHESVPRGTKIDLTLTGVVDNSGVVNDVHLFDDAERQSIT